MTKLFSREKPLLCEGAPLVAAEWFAAKMFREKKRTGLYLTSILFVFGETEKAYHVVLGGIGDSVVTWIPKKCVNAAPADDENAVTYYCDCFADVVEGLDYLRALYC